LISALPIHSITSSARPSNVEPERLGGLGVEHQLEFFRLLHRKVRGLLAPEDAVDVTGGEPVVSSIMAAGLSVSFG
jgi:hypothetical protein